MIQLMKGINLARDVQESDLDYWDFGAFDRWAGTWCEPLKAALRG